MGLAAFNRARRMRAEQEAAEQESLLGKPIDKMTVAELREYATANNIDLGDATKKDDILAVIEGGE